MALWSRFLPVRRMLFFSIIDNRRWDLRGSVAVKLRVRRCIDTQETFTRDWKKFGRVNGSVNPKPVLWQLWVI